MAYDQSRGSGYDGAPYGKRPRGDGNGYGMQPQQPKRNMMGSQEFGGMVPGGKGGPSMSYGGDYVSPPQKMARPAGPSIHDDKQSNVLLFNIVNPKYPITVDVMHTICQPQGAVNRIMIFRKSGIQAMVEFENADDAERAKEALDGADIYSGCCTLKIQLAKPTRLNVVRNDSDSWDYTNPNLGKEVKSQPLLPDPKFEPQMYGGRGGQSGRMENAPPPRRGPPPQSRMEYDNYAPQPMMDSFRGPPRGGPPAHSRFPAQRQPSQRQPPPQELYGEQYGPPRPPMRSGPRPPGPNHQMLPMGQEEYDDQGQSSGGGGMLQQGSVLMVYGLHPEKMNCQRMFNLFCLYGNVVRVKFLKSKEGSAMIQLGDNASCQRAVQNLNGSFIFGTKLQLGFSKQAFIQDVPNPYELPDGSPSFLDFMGSRNNRYSTPEAAAKNRVQPASKSLYFFNSPPGLDEDTIRKIFIDLDVKAPDTVKIFQAKSERSSTGLLEWDSKGDAMEALIVANHQPLPNPSGKNPYVMKMCFSGTNPN